MSYVRFDDKHENGRLSELCQRLSGEVQAQTGEKFSIFHDSKDIAWGQQWQERIFESLDAVTFLIPILTPSFFKSEACRSELEDFIEREKRFKRNDLILPIYYIGCKALSEAAKLEADRLAKIIAARQYVDWRELRFEPLTDPRVGQTLAKNGKKSCGNPHRIRYVSLTRLDPRNRARDGPALHRFPSAPLRASGGGRTYRRSRPSTKSTRHLHR
jgi:hypothetical protein